MNLQDNKASARFDGHITLRGLIAGSGITLSGDPRRPTISANGGSSTVTWADIQNKPTTFAPAAHTHAANEISFGQSDVGSALANALKDGDSGKSLVNLNLTGVTTIKDSFVYESAATTPKTKVYFGNTQTGINITTEAAAIQVTNGEFLVYGNEGSTFVMTLPFLLRKDISFQGGAIVGPMLWKNGAGTIRPIFNHTDATDGALTLPKNAGTLALVEELPTGVPSGGTNTTFLRGDGTWVTPTNTTYSLIPEAEFNTGTANTSRTVSAITLNRDIRAKIISYLLSLPNAGAGKVLTIDTAGTGFEWKTLA